MPYEDNHFAGKLCWLGASRHPAAVMHVTTVILTIIHHQEPTE